MFNESRLLDCVAYGSEFGQRFKTRITELRSGVERRNIEWAMPLGVYSILYQALAPADHVKVRGAHMASMGAAIPFRFKDWTDFEAAGEVIGESDGTLQTMQLVKRYEFGSYYLERVIQKPVAGTVQVYADGVEIPSTVNVLTGVITIEQTAGKVITWTGEFDIPVRFEDDRLDVDVNARGAGGFVLSSDVSLIEVRL